MLLKNATIATMTGDAPYGLIESGRSRSPTARSAGSVPRRTARASGRGGRGHAGPADHARPDRLSHARRLWWGPRGRIRNAAERGQLRGGGARRGGYRLDRPRHARHRRGCDLLADALRRVDALLAEGRLGDRGQVGLRAGYRYRAQDAACRPRDTQGAGRARPDDVSRRARHARTTTRAAPTHTFRGNVPAGPARRARGGSGRRGRRVLRRHRLFGRRAASRFSRRRARGACRSSCMPSSSAISAARGWRPRDSGRCRRTTSNMPTRRMPPRWPGRAASRPSCPAPSTRCAKRRCHRSARFASTACRWRWPPTATPVRRRSPRCC